MLRIKNVVAISRYGFENNIFQYLFYKLYYPNTLLTKNIVILKYIETPKFMSVYLASTSLIQIALQNKLIQNTHKLYIIILTMPSWLESLAFGNAATIECARWKRCCVDGYLPNKCRLFYYTTTITEPKRSYKCLHRALRNIPLHSSESTDTV